MNNLFTIKTALVLLTLILCQLSLKAQNTNTTIIVPDKQDTIHITLVVTPGQNGGKSTIAVAASQSGSTATALVTKTPPKPSVITGNSAPNVAERSGAATYMTRPVPAAAAVPLSVASGNTAAVSGRPGTTATGTTPVKTLSTSPSAATPGANTLSTTPAGTSAVKTTTGTATAAGTGLAVKPAITITTPASGSVTGGISTPGVPAKSTTANSTGTATPANTISAPINTSALGTTKKDSLKKDSLNKALAKKDTAKKDTSSSDTLVHHRARIAFLEFGGPGLAITANYDVRFEAKQDGWGIRVGAGYFASGGQTVFTVPIQVNYLYGNGTSFLELGGGTTFLHSNGNNYQSKHFIFDKITGFIGTATIGYRYEPAASKFNFRIGFVPLFSDEGITPAGGISFGYTFQ